MGSFLSATATRESETRPRSRLERNDPTSTLAPAAAWP